MDRPLPKAATDWGLFEDLIRVHQAVSADVFPDFYQWWAEWNRAYFGSTLRPLFITSGNTDYGKAIGLCRYVPLREILLQKQGIKTPEPKGGHHGATVRQHPAFAGLPYRHWCLALILLHEMIHQACFEAGADPGHESASWAAHCNHISQDLGLGLTYSPMVRRKVTRRDANGATVRDEAGGLVRDNVRVPLSTELLPGTDRFATFDEQCCFPWRDGDPFILANTVTLTEGKAVQANKGEPVIIRPKF